MSQNTINYQYGKISATILFMRRFSRALRVFPIKIRFVELISPLNRDLKFLSLSHDSLFLFQPVSRCRQNSVWNIYVSSKFYIPFGTLDVYSSSGHLTHLNLKQLGTFVLYLWKFLHVLPGTLRPEDL